MKLIGFAIGTGLSLPSAYILGQQFGYANLSLGVVGLGLGLAATLIAMVAKAKILGFLLGYSISLPSAYFLGLQFGHAVMGASALAVVLAVAFALVSLLAEGKTVSR